MIRIDADFPKTCSECPLWYDDDCCCHQYCVLTDREITDFMYLAKDGECPLIEEEENANDKGSN